jgi:hypothetical protein
MTQVIHKDPAETIRVPYDFSALFAAAGNTYATFSTTVDVGLSAYDAARYDDVVTLTLGGGTDGVQYAATVNAATDAGTLSITKLILAQNPISIIGVLSVYADAYADAYA